MNFWPFCCVAMVLIVCLTIFKVNENEVKIVRERVLCKELRKDMKIYTWCEDLEKLILKDYARD